MGDQICPRRVMQADLPAPWQVHISASTGKPYWHNPETKESTWMCPVKEPEQEQGNKVEKPKNKVLAILHKMYMGKKSSQFVATQSRGVSTHHHPVATTSAAINGPIGLPQKTIWASSAKDTELQSDGTQALQSHPQFSKTLQTVVAENIYKVTITCCIIYPFASSFACSFGIGVAQMSITVTFYNFLSRRL